MEFLLGGFSAMCAGVITNPLDVIKTRQQLQGELQHGLKKQQLPYRNIFHSVKSIIQAEGIRGIQKGLKPALCFQFVMNSTRLGTFETVDKLKWTSFKNNERSPILCVFWGGLSGVIGSSLGCPFFLIKTQIQSKSHGIYAVGYQHNHQGMIDAIKKIFNEGGVKGLWRGYTGMVARVAVGSSTQLTTFSMSKEFLSNYEVFNDSVFLKAFTASMLSGLFTVIVMTPFDVVSTRLFNQGIDKNGKGILYKNIFDCFYKTFKHEGFLGLYKGFGPNYWRTGPHTIINLTIWEELKKIKNIYAPNV